MRLSILITVLQLTTVAMPISSSTAKPDKVVQGLYSAIVVHHPLGIPKGEERSAIWPMLSKRLTRVLDTAQECETDYFRQHPQGDEKPEFSWLESGIFSGDNEEALPAKAVVGRPVARKGGSFEVPVQLAYVDTQQPGEKTASPEKFNWNVVAIVVLEEGKFVIDDVLFQQEGSERKSSKLSEKFVGCTGPRWSR